MRGALRVSEPLEPPKRPAVAFVGAVQRARRSNQAFEPAHLEFLGTWRRRDVAVELARLGFGQVVLGERVDDHRLLSVRARDADFVARPEVPIRLARGAVDLDLPALARLLRL